MARSGAFISYARADGEAFATDLRERLQHEAPGFRVWQDRPELEGGVGWWRQIEDALEQVEFLVIVLTPGALASQVTRKEWRAARQAGVCVFPVKGPGYDFNDPRIPGWMQRAHVYDLSAQWPAFVAHLQRGCQCVRVPFMVPPLPAGLVARPREYEALRSLVLDANTGDTVAITTSLAGAGGFGKTTLAAALCHDDAVASAYDDGVLWVTLGQQPNVQGELTRLFAALTGERPGFISIEDAAQALAEKLEHKRCLIVVDDVWDVAHLRPFVRGGPLCARLVTTRQMQVAQEGQRVDVDQMTPQEAVRLLLARLPEPPADLEPLRALSRRLGEWPLLLRLAGSALRRRIDQGDTLSGALRYVERALQRHGVTAFDRDKPLDRHEAVSSTLAMSLDLLAPPDRARCAELAIFPEDVAIPAAVLAGLWGLDDFDTEDTLTRLHDGSLIEFDLAAGAVRVHDVMRVCYGRQLGEGAPQVHARLLRSWGDLHQLPHRYAWRRVAHHLAGAGEAEALPRLLSNFAWLQRKLEATDVYALLEDFGQVPADDARLQTLQQALRLSSHVLGRDKSQLASQLLGRIGAPQQMLGLELTPEVMPSVRPLFASLSGPGGALMRTLECPGTPTTLAATPDGRWLVAGTDQGSIAVWELASGTLVRTLQTPADEAVLNTAGWGAAFAPLHDGRLLLPGGRALLVWNPAEDAPPQPVLEGRDLFGSLAVSRDGRWALMGSRRGALHLHDLHGGPTRPLRPSHRLGVGSVAFSGDERLALSGSYDKTLRVWDIASGELVDTLYPPHVGIVYGVAAARDVPVAASASGDGTVRLWDLNTLTLKATLEGHRHRVYAVALSHDGRRVLSASHDRTVRVWDAVEGTARATLSGHSEAATAVIFLPGEQSAVSAARDGTLRVWQLEAADHRAPTQEHEGPIHAVAVTADGRTALSGGQDRQLRLWDVATGRVRQVLSGHHDAVTTVALDPLGRHAVSGSHDRQLILWDLSTGQAQLQMRGHGDALASVAFDADAGWVLSGSWDGDLAVWVDRPWPRRRWFAHRRGITFVELVAEQRRAVSGGMDGDLKVWDTSTARCERSVHAHVGGISAGALNLAAGLVLTGGTDGALRLWRWPTLELLHTVQGHTGRISCVGFDAAAHVAFSSSADRYVKLWSLPALQARGAFACDAAIGSAALDAAGRSLVAGDAQGCVHFLGVG